MANNPKISGRADAGKTISAKKNSIRLSDLLPKRSVSGGNKVIFGGSLGGAAERQSTQTKNQTT